MIAARRWIATVRILVHVLLGLLIVFVRFEGAPPQLREKLIRQWSTSLLRYLGIRVELKGSYAAGGNKSGALLVLNHVSWIDIYLVNSYHATSFVAKAEIRSWPFLGWLCAKTGTIFLQRDRRSGLRRVIEQSCEVLQDGGTVGIFPEGTTTDGSELLPFHSNLLESACVSGVDVIPVALRYMDVSGAASRAPAYIGETSLWKTLQTTLDAAPIIAELTFLPRIDSQLGRRKIAEIARGEIAGSLGQ